MCFLTSVTCLNFVLSNVLRILIIFAIDAAAYLDFKRVPCSFTLVQLCTAFNGLSFRPETIMTNAFLSIFLWATLFFCALVSSRLCRAPAILGFHYWKSSFCEALSVGSLALYIFSASFFMTFLVMLPLIWSSDKFFWIHTTELQCNDLPNLQQLSCSFKSSGTLSIRVVNHWSNFGCWISQSMFVPFSTDCSSSIPFLHFPIYLLRVLVVDLELRTFYIIFFILSFPPFLSYFLVSNCFFVFLRLIELLCLTAHVYDTQYSQSFLSVIHYLCTE